MYVEAKHPFNGGFNLLTLTGRPDVPTIGNLPLAILMTPPRIPETHIQGQFQ